MVSGATHGVPTDTLALPCRHVLNAVPLPAAAHCATGCMLEAKAPLVVTIPLALRVAVATGVPSTEAVRVPGDVSENAAMWLPSRTTDRSWPKETRPLYIEDGASFQAVKGSENTMREGSEVDGSSLT